MKEDKEEKKFEDEKNKQNKSEQRKQELEIELKEDKEEKKFDPEINKKEGKKKEEHQMEEESNSNISMRTRINFFENKNRPKKDKNAIINSQVYEQNELPRPNESNRPQ